MNQAQTTALRSRATFHRVLSSPQNAVRPLPCSLFYLLSSRFCFSSRSRHFPCACLPADNTSLDDAIANSSNALLPLPICAARCACNFLRIPILKRRPARTGRSLFARKSKIIIWFSPMIPLPPLCTLVLPKLPRNWFSPPSRVSRKRRKSVSSLFPALRFAPRVSPSLPSASSANLSTRVRTAFWTPLPWGMAPKVAWLYSPARMRHLRFFASIPQDSLRKRFLSLPRAQVRAILAANSLSTRVRWPSFCQARVASSLGRLPLMPSAIPPRQLGAHQLF